MKAAFDRIAARVTAASGSPWATAAAVLIVAAWAFSGPFLGFSTLWQLTINTGTTIITFLMVFLIQASQNRDTKALNVKLDALIAAIADADNAVLDAERQPQAVIEQQIEAVTQAAKEHQP